MNALIVENNILATLNVKKPAASFVFTSKIGLPRVVPVLQWVLFVRQIFVSPHSEFEQHMYSSDPSPDTVSFMQLESRRAAPQASQPPSKASGRTFNSTTQQRPRSGNPLQTSRSRTLFSFSCSLRADQEAVSRFAAFLLWIKAFALQKRLLSVLFTQAVRTAAILNVAINVMRRKGCAVQNKGITSKGRKLWSQVKKMLTSSY